MRSARSTHRSRKPILFNGATFGDLQRGKGPLVLASATDISTGSRLVFNQSTFDILCSDLSAVRLSTRRCPTGPAASPTPTIRRGLPHGPSLPPTQWDESETPPGTVEIMLKAAGTPIDAHSYEATELLKDTAARWQTMRLIRNSAALQGNADPAVSAALRVPNPEIHAIDVSFPALKDKAELAYLNQQPTSFVLPDEAVDRLRAAAGTIIVDSPGFKRLLKGAGPSVLAAPPAPKK